MKTVRRPSLIYTQRTDKYTLFTLFSVSFSSVSLASYYYGACKYEYYKFSFKYQTVFITHATSVTFYSGVEQLSVACLNAALCDFSFLSNVNKNNSLKNNDFYWPLKIKVLGLSCRVVQKFS